MNRIILTYCSSSHHWHLDSPLSGYTCWSWRCSFHFCTELDRLCTVWLTNTKTWDNVYKLKMSFDRKNSFNLETGLTVTEDFVRIVPAVVLPVAPGAVPHTAAVYTASVTLLAHPVGWEPDTQWYITNVNNTNIVGNVLTKRKLPLTTVGLFLIRLVFAVGHAITSQRVVNTISISTLKLIKVVTCSVKGCEK